MGRVEIFCSECFSDWGLYLFFLSWVTRVFGKPTLGNSPGAIQSGFAKECRTAFGFGTKGPDTFSSRLFLDFIADLFHVFADTTSRVSTARHAQCE